MKTPSMDDKRINRLATDVYKAVREQYGKGPKSIWSVLSPEIRGELVMAAAFARIRARDADMHSEDMDRLANECRRLFETEID